MIAVTPSRSRDPNVTTTVCNYDRNHTLVQPPRQGPGRADQPDAGERLGALPDGRGCGEGGAGEA